MYMFKKINKKDVLNGRTITYMAKEIGITNQYLTNIFNHKISCSKLVAYCITKFLNSNAEINDYFIAKGE